MREEFSSRDHVELHRSGKSGDHLTGPRQRKERISLTVHQVDRHGDPVVQLGQRAEGAEVELPAEIPGRSTASRVVTQRAEEELGELTVEQITIGEAVTQDELVAANPRLVDEVGQQVLEAGHHTDGQKRTEAKTRAGCSVSIRPQERTRGSPARA